MGPRRRAAGRRRDRLGEPRRPQARPGVLRAAGRARGGRSRARSPTSATVPTTTCFPRSRRGWSPCTFDAVPGGCSRRHRRGRCLSRRSRRSPGVVLSPEAERVALREGTEGPPELSVAVVSERAPCGAVEAGENALRGEARSAGPSRSDGRGSRPRGQSARRSHKAVRSQSRTIVVIVCFERRARRASSPIRPVLLEERDQHRPVGRPYLGNPASRSPGDARSSAAKPSRAGSRGSPVSHGASESGARRVQWRCCPGAVGIVDDHAPPVGATAKDVGAETALSDRRAVGPRRLELPAVGDERGVADSRTCSMRPLMRGLSAKARTGTWRIARDRSPCARLGRTPRRPRRKAPPALQDGRHRGGSEK